MNWLILGAVSAAVAALAFVCLWRTYAPYDDIFFFVGCIAFVVAAFCIPIYFIGSISESQNISQFEQQKQYIEAHVANSTVEDAALTNKKIELNEWLYDAQWAREHLGGWSFYPESILEETPIR